MGGRMKHWFVSSALGLMLLSPAAHPGDERVFLKELLIKRDPDFQAALQRGIDSASGVKGAGGGFFPFAEVDLNNDKTPELLIAYQTSYFSGSAGNYPIEIFTQHPGAGWRWLGRVWGREGNPLILGKPSKGWTTIRFEKHVYCWKDLAEGETPPETGLAGHVPQGGMYVYCSENT